MRTLTSHTTLSAQLAATVGGLAIAFASVSAFAAPAKPAAKAAAPASASASAAKAKADDGPPVLTRDELRACRSKQARILQLKDGLDAEQATIASLQADIVQRGEALNTKLETIDRTKQEAIDSYNADIKARQSLVDQYDAKVTALKGHFDAAKAESDAFAADCGNRRSLDSDAKALDEGK